MRTILMVVAAFVLIGLAVALLEVFNWDIGALFEWAWGAAMGIVNAIADLFAGNSFFQRMVN